MPIANALAEWAVAFTLDQAPADVRDTARLCCLDTIGVALAGSETAAARCAAEALANHAGACGFWGMSRRGDLSAALFVNATSASALDLDDGHLLAVGHAGSGVVPAVFTSAERLNPSGRALLEAVIVGYEIAVRAALARARQQIDSFSSGNWLPVGVAAALGRLHGLSAEQVAHALAIAAAYAPQAPLSPSLATGAMVKEAVGWGALVGGQAVALAQAGFRGALTILEHADIFQAERWLQGLGQTWALRQVYFKPYATCRWAHAPIDAALQIMRRHNLQADAVLAVQVETFRAATLLNDPAPATLEKAQYSIPWALAVAIQHDDVGPQQMRAEMLGDAQLVSLARKVYIHEAADLQARFPQTRSARVTVETAQGRYQATVHHPRGSPENPLSAEWLTERFVALAASVIGPSEVARLCLELQRLEHLTQTASLVERLQPVQRGEP